MLTQKLIEIMSNKECNCYMSKMGLNCERIADISKMVIDMELDMVGASWYIQELLTEGTISVIECIAVSTQLGLFVAREKPILEPFSDN